MDHNTRSRRKVLAVLAAGAVLGLGAAVTLAAWNDSEFVTGTFTSGSFNLEGSLNGTAYSDHETAPGGALNFTVDADNLAPDDTVYAAFAVRLDADTTRDADVALTVHGTSGTVTGLSYGLVRTGSFGCDSAAFQGGTPLVATGTALTAGTGSFDLEAGAGPAAGDPVFLCWEVTAGAIAQDQSGSATWRFQANSN